MRAGDALYQTTYAYDPLVSVTAADGAATSYVYATAANSSAWSTTVTDAAGKKKIYVTDALGRVITVYEDPNGANYAASYFYDPLGDLTGVVQGYCPSHQGQELADVVAAGQLGHHAAVIGVQLDLAVQRMGQQPLPGRVRLPAQQRHAGLVAGALDAQDRPVVDRL